MSMPSPTILEMAEPSRSDRFHSHWTAGLMKEMSSTSEASAIQAKPPIARMRRW